MARESSRWYAVQTRPTSEALAVEQLRRQGLEVFFPQRAKTVRHARRTEQRIVSYFPGYIFVSLDTASSAWRSVNGTIGVRSLVMFGDRPALVPRGLIDGLASMIGPGGFITSAPTLVAGDTVRITDGPFADLIGAVERVEGHARVRILIDLLSGAVPIVANASHVALAS